MDPTGKVALVTGGARGIGFEICKELLRAGVKSVSVCDLNDDEGQKAAKQLCTEFDKDRATFIKTDVTNPTDFEEAFKKTIKMQGRIDIVVNNAGICNEKQWEKQLEINLNAVIKGTLLGLQYMGKDKNGQGGTVVNMASVCGIYAFSPLPMYTASKHGVMGFTRTLGDEYHFNMTGVRIMAICPGITSTLLFRDVANNIYNDKWAEEWDRICSTMVEQEPEYVGRGVVQIVKSARSGSLWVSEARKPIYEVRVDIIPVQ